MTALLFFILQLPLIETRFADLPEGPLQAPTPVMTDLPKPVYGRRDNHKFRDSRCRFRR